MKKKKWKEITKLQKISYFVILVVSLVATILGGISWLRPYGVGGHSWRPYDGMRDLTSESLPSIKTAVRSAFIGGIIAFLLGCVGMTVASNIRIWSENKVLIIVGSILALGAIIAGIIAIVANTNLSSEAWWIKKGMAVAKGSNSLISEHWFSYRTFIT